jgi:predicted Zn-dependent peptidase
MPLLETHFGGWKEAPKGPMMGSRSPDALNGPPRDRREIYLVDKPGAVQTTLIVGLPTIDASHVDAISLSVANNVLGGYFSSRICWLR